MAFMDRENYSRRRVLRTGGSLAVIAGLAGCSGNQGNDSGGGATQGNDSGGGATEKSSGGTSQGTDGTSQQGTNGTTALVDTPLTVVALSTTTDKYQLNVFGPNSPSQGFPQLVSSPYLVYDAEKDEYIYNLLKDVTVDGKTMTVTMADGFTWHNGDPVTAQDLVTQFKILKMSGLSHRVLGDASGVVESIEQSGDLTAEIMLTDELNPNIVINGFRIAYLANTWNDTKMPHPKVTKNR
jgi:peptide/nickel transport system substrate-binding protein